MKKITTILVLFAAMIATSCQSGDEAGPMGTEQKLDGAYLTISLDTPYSRAATSESQDGTTDTEASKPIGDEGTLSSIVLIAFDKNYDYISSYPPVAVTAGTKKFECEVAPDARRFFVVVNPTAAIIEDINNITSFNQEQFEKLSAVLMKAADVSTGNVDGSGNARGFTMVNCGFKNSDGILLEALASVDTALSQDENAPSSLTISVDRLVSKFEYSIGTNFDADTAAAGGNLAIGKVDGVALTATNKATLIYSVITMDNLTGGNVYRKDHNMMVGSDVSGATATIAELNKNFNWLKNENEDTDNAFISADDASRAPEYALENTCEAAYSNSNNLTQAIVKAQYNPVLTDGTVPALGTSWFKIITDKGAGTLYLEFDDVKKLYEGNYPGFVPDAAAKASMDKQLNYIMSKADGSKKWEDADVTLAALDACPYGGYRAATVGSTKDSSGVVTPGVENDYVVQYYQKAVNYYDIFIHHDSAQLEDHPGRWGMVRNNSYTLNISHILKEGLPYIPDPTDPAIVDPENQDPEDPEPADKKNGYIDVTIEVRNWVLWYQDSPLM